MDRLVPVVFTVPVEGWEHDGKDGGRVVTDQTHNVLIVPVVEGSLRHLEVGTGHALGELSEQRHLDLLELGRLDHVEDLLQLVEEHDLLGTVDLGPEPQETADDWLGEGGILLQELDHTVSQQEEMTRPRLLLRPKSTR